MTILLFGANGQVGWELRRSLAPLGPLDARTRNDRGGDLADPDAVAALIRDLRPSVVVNAAAHTAVDRAESEPELAQLLNCAAPSAMADACKRTNALLVHYSTDYVFPGNGTSAWREADATDPQNVYGLSKRDGEDAIIASGCHHLIFRTSWVYAARGGNFAKTMLGLACERDALGVVADQVGAPTGADLIADVTAHAIMQARTDQNSGLFHLAAAGETSWHDYARFAIAHARILGWPITVEDAAIAPVATSAYPTPAARPANSRLDTSALRARFGLTLPDWRLGVARMIDELPVPA
jgi:dTDP-4-dehydrorhamnose reductase